MIKFDRTPRTLTGTLQPGRAGTIETVAMMCRLADAGGRDDMIRKLAQRIANGSPDARASLLRLFVFVRDRVRYVKDPHGLELLQAPWVTLTRGSGDCDDKATLLVGLARAISLPFEFAFRVIGTNPRYPMIFSHVYVTARGRGGLLVLDPTHKGTPAGWEYPHQTRQEDFAL